MKSRVTRFALLLALFILPLLPHRAAAQAGKFSYLYMTTVESVLGGGGGRSRILFTPDFKGQKEVTIESPFGITGINFGNIHANDDATARFLTELNSEGWELLQVVPLTISPSAGTGSLASTGIFMTRYLFRKPQ
ncbi:hypothetical protein LGH70_01690 [Hymenobacter sp. BT635]|uniref:DUF4177 domain-containing protein n=1 Tax=Hymenobacter nitidus TaxID=2880929 RepID=A0ABS8A7A2_9BACT|nr:hypothetical protein [Hymenobacter nitidus]MCB2376275.1 hypothetical protein [Hymenobacter nitidus]